MKIIAELPPSASRETLARRVSLVLNYTDIVDIPDSPGGRPSAHAIAVAYIAKNMGASPITHMRIRDINLLAYKSLLGAARLFELRDIVVLTGDPPTVGSPVDQLTTEEAVRIGKEYGFRVGALLSMRRNYSERLKMGADFYLVLNLADPKSMETLRGVAAYPYVMIRTEKNSQLLARLGQPSVTLDQLLRYVEELEPFAEAIVASAPGDFEAELRALDLLTKR
ncbi:5,10-methylenetetrahydrofolate reductase [Thermoproteus tenax]|uniref:5,10-methylenetetrahydrofolate reductase n=1 Tax=Thermoproteus tenax (strain ATCC 35583 / DSM 2078 / JCM 9277 / NBRC 100435 / Kra 1) TaxID=768679 RepID=G4RKT2_THETK|nr:5,10-methylenetetrahydrofolate reductase [Thermoproteus tenax]CCC82177.1 5,10-methylenetetrahydrofolate reductase [Thermoproteus tenax Kra 1]